MPEASDGTPTPVAELEREAEMESGNGSEPETGKAPETDTYMDEIRTLDIRNEGLEFCHSSAWDKYEEVEDFGADRQKANDHDFMTSNDQYIHMWLRGELRYILYAYERQIARDLLAESWTIDRMPQNSK